MSNFSIPTICLVQQAHTLAQQFAQEQATSQQGKQIYLNTLAVYAVHTHLKRLGIVSDLEQSDSWNPVMRALFHASDLLLPTIGKLECCPLLPGQTQMPIPEAIEACIGYVAVQFGEQLGSVQLLGFVSAAEVSAETVAWPIANLQPFEQLLDCLPERQASLPERQASLPECQASLPERQTNTQVKLRDWFDHSFGAGWQTVEALLDQEPLQFAFGFRGSSVPAGEVTAIGKPSVSACKVIDFAKHSTEKLPIEAWQLPLSAASDRQPDKLRLVLLMHLSQAAEAIDISLRVCPLDQQLYLPAELQLAVWDQVGTLIQADTRHINNWIELEFSGQPGECFSLKVAIGEVSMTEEFLI